MWSIFSYAYNTILILFIASHLLVGATISFLIGLYIGIYITQNYSVPRITEPSSLWEKFVLFMEKHRLDKKSFRQMLRPSTVMSIVKDDCHASINGGYVDMDSGRPGTPTLIFTDAEESVGKSKSEIVEASLLINSHLKGE